MLLYVSDYYFLYAHLFAFRKGYIEEKELDAFFLPHVDKTGC